MTERSEIERLEQLEQRYKRERRARREAEIIAERGMRELWLANSELQQRVTRRTAELERSIRARDIRARAQLDVIASVVDAERDSGEAGGACPDRTAEVLQSMVETPEAGPRHVEPLEFSDALLAAWQHEAARAGQLLSVELEGGPNRVNVDDAALQALADVLIGRSVKFAPPGSVRVRISTTPGQVSLAVSDGSLDTDGVELHIAVATVVARRAGGSVEVVSAGEVTSITASVPAQPVGV